MSNSAAETFTQALQTLEEKGDAGPIVACFGEQAELTNLSAAEHGGQGAERFWSAYRSQFDEIRSEFKRSIAGGDDVVLIWRSQGKLRGGAPIKYDGVSILTFNGDKIAKFETIYDSAAFMRGSVITSG